MSKAPIGAAVAVGVDRGVAVPYALSTGEMIRLPETVPAIECALRRAQKTLSRREPRLRRYTLARVRLAKLKGRQARIRAHVAHTLSRDLVRRFGLVAMEPF